MFNSLGPVDVFVWGVGPRTLIIASSRLGASSKTGGAGRRFGEGEAGEREVGEYEGWKSEKLADFGARLTEINAGLRL